VAFGGSDLTTLFVTTAVAGAPEGERLAGSLFAIETNACLTNGKCNMAVLAAAAARY
jgi:hypothetical protein